MIRLTPCCLLPVSLPNIEKKINLLLQPFFGKNNVQGPLKIFFMVVYYQPYAPATWNMSVWATKVLQVREVEITP